MRFKFNIGLRDVYFFNIVLVRLATAMLSSDRNFWDEVKRIRSHSTVSSRTVDGISDASCRLYRSFLQINIRTCIILFHMMVLSCRAYLMN